MRHLYRAQRDALVDVLASRAGGQLSVVPPGQGMHLVAHFRDGRSDIEVERAAAGAGIVVRAISRFYRAAAPRPGLMLGFSGFPRQRVIPAAARLAALVAGRNAP